jgi:hypothetical protein
VSRRRLLTKLERVTEQPVLLIAASWRPDIATDLDGNAARVVSDALDTIDSDRLTVVLGARGGEAVFADQVARSLRARGISFDLAVPTFVSGVDGLLAIAADRVLIHPHGGVGAYDAGPMQSKFSTLGPHLFDDVPALGGVEYGHDPQLPARLAGGLRERRLSRQLAGRLAGEGVDYDALSHIGLGQDLGLDAEELRAAGFDAETWNEPALWSLWLSVESELGVLEAAEPPYTEADIGMEVEFAPAVGLLGALVETKKRVHRYELDTGSPDPDTGAYAGAS